MNQINPTHIRYDALTIRLHWLSAALVLGLWCVGQAIDWFPKGAPRVWVRSSHIALGILLLAIIAYRLYWRRTGASHLPAPPNMSIGQVRLATGLHHLLYLAMITVLLLGVANTWVRGDNIFNLFRIPAWDPTNKALRGNVEELHALAANLLIALAGLHAAAGLAHHYLLKDSVLQRMLPFTEDRR